jgi:hypothetical protein
MDFLVAPPQLHKISIDIDTLIEGLMAICVGGIIKVDDQGPFICLNFWEPADVPMITERLEPTDPRLELVAALRVVRRFHDAGLAKLNMDTVKITPTAAEGKVIKPAFRQWPSTEQPDFPSPV